MLMAEPFLQAPSLAYIGGTTNPFPTISTAPSHGFSQQPEEVSSAVLLDRSLSMPIESWHS
jgi:hypothetical protein